jgi:hypothetical protein
MIAIPVRTHASNVRSEAKKTRGSDSEMGTRLTPADTDEKNAFDSVIRRQKTAALISRPAKTARPFSRRSVGYPESPLSV